MTQTAYSVTQLLTVLKTTLETNPAFRGFWLKGEMSNTTFHRSGHWYFTLKDENASISCVMFANAANTVTFKPKDGDQVLIKASVTVYPPQGKVQLSVSSMSLDGIGDLYLRFEALKKKLFAEGLFDEQRKKPLPRYPQQVGIITGANTAALKDIQKTLGLRWPGLALTLYPVLVQGEGAPAQLLQALIQADAAHLDVVILARGGGSMEDLWAFNDESIARQISRMVTPVVTGIGHEVDTTIADYVADLRAATPTAAAQSVVRDFREVQAELKQLHLTINRLMRQRLQQHRLMFNPLLTHPLWANPELLTQDAAMNLTMLTQRLLNFTASVTPKSTTLQTLRQRLQVSAVQRIHGDTTSLERLQQRITTGVIQRLTFEKSTYAARLGLLNAYSPLNVLERGYAIALKDLHALRSVNDTEIGESIHVRLTDGTLTATVTGKEPYGKKQL
jgi:exodeoxyribonuclease VII large subunit